MNLIGISGYMGSGKSTVGEILQKLTAATPKGDFDWKLFTTWEQKAFAGKLKQIASILTGIPVERFEDQEFKKQINPQTGETYRKLLTDIGDKIREIDKDYWVNALFANYDNKIEFIDTSNNKWRLDYNPVFDGPENKWKPNWIITDVRFPNEAQAIKDRGGIVIRVNRDGYAQNARVHASENSLDDWDFDAYIDNNADLNSLIEKVKEMLTVFKVL